VEKVKIQAQCTQKAELGKCQDTINSTHSQENLEIHHSAKNTDIERNKNTRSIKLAVTHTYPMHKETYTFPHKFYNYTC
jgi:hypothetical protein